MNHRLFVAGGVAALLAVILIKWIGAPPRSKPVPELEENRPEPVQEPPPTDLVSLRLEKAPGWSVSVSRSPVADGDPNLLINTTTVSLPNLNSMPIDTWESEAATDQITSLLHDLFAAERDNVETLLAPFFQCSELRPSDRKIVFQNSIVRIERGTHDKSTLMPETGPTAWSTAWAALKNGSDNLYAKVISLDIDDRDTHRARVLVSGTSNIDSPNRWQWNAEWRCSWSTSDPTKLVSLQCESYAEATLTSRDSKAPLFRDATAAVFGHLDHYDGQILTGIENWASKLSRIDEMVMTGHHGLAIGDVNGDGREDLYLCDAGGLTNRLYLKNADGTVSDHSHSSGVDFLEDSRAALLVDLDNDGDQDLVVSMLELIVIAENDGLGRFAVRGGFAGSPNAYSMSAADFDNDGLLDIFVCVYGPHEKATGTRGFEARSPTPFYDANNGGSNVLLRNHGGFCFTDATLKTQLNVGNHRWSFASAWEDFDRDGDPDLYVANDFGRNCFYENRNGVFVEVAARKGVEDQAAGMSVAWGDYNRDGRPDLYVGNMFSAAGQRVTYQRQFAQMRSDEKSRLGLQRMAQGNTLFAGTESGFADTTTDLGVAMGRWAWSSGFADINNDGWQDLVIANGYMTNSQSAPDL